MLRKSGNANAQKKWKYEDDISAKFMIPAGEEPFEDEIFPGHIVQLGARDSGVYGQVIDFASERTEALIKFFPFLNYEALKRQPPHEMSQARLSEEEAQKSRWQAFDLDFFSSRNSQLSKAPVKIAGMDITMNQWDNKKFYGKFQYNIFHRSDGVYLTEVPRPIKNRFRKFVADFELKIRGFTERMEQCPEITEVPSSEPLDLSNLTFPIFRSSLFEPVSLEEMWLRDDPEQPQSFVQKYSMLMLQQYVDPNDMLKIMKQGLSTIRNYNAKANPPDHRADYIIGFLNGDVTLESLVETHKGETKAIQEIQKTYFRNFLPLINDIRKWDRENEKLLKQSNKKQKW